MALPTADSQLTPLARASMSLKPKRSVNSRISRAPMTSAPLATSMRLVWSILARALRSSIGMMLPAKLSSTALTA